MTNNKIKLLSLIVIIGLAIIYYRVTQSIKNDYKPPLSLNTENTVNLKIKGASMKNQSSENYSILIVKKTNRIIYGCIK